MYVRTHGAPRRVAFDAPGRVQACTRRLRSDIPLQALTLLNDEAFVEIARTLAERLLAELPSPASDRARIEYAFRLCLGRPPADREIRELEDVLEQERGVESSRSNGFPAWMTVARILLNLDEIVTRE
jgi:hypothetical protein